MDYIKLWSFFTEKETMKKENEKATYRVGDRIPKGKNILKYDWK